MVYTFKEMCVCFFKMKNRIIDYWVVHRSGKRYSWCLDTVMKPSKYLQTLAVQASQISDKLKTLSFRSLLPQ